MLADFEKESVRREDSTELEIVKHDCERKDAPACVGILQEDRSNHEPRTCGGRACRKTY